MHCRRICAVIGFVMVASLTVGLDSFAAGGEIAWRSDINSAARDASTTGRPMLVKFSTDWCTYCKKMQRETFSDRNIIGHVNQCFIPVHLDGDKHRKLVKQLGITSYPTTVVISPRMQMVAKIKGYRTVKQLTKDLNRVCKHDNAPGKHTNLTARQTKPTRTSVFGSLCPVSPIETGEFTPASPEHRVTFRGFEIGFANAEFKDRFLDQPQKYWPIGDGRCVVSARDARTNRLGNLDHGLMYEERVWLFASDQERERFRADPAVYAEWYWNQHQARRSTRSMR